MAENHKGSGSHATALALILLAAAIAYLGYSLSTIAVKIDPILEQVDEVNARVDTLAKVASDYHDDIPVIAAEVGAISGQIPDVLERVASLQAQIKELQQDVPLLLDTHIPPLLKRIDTAQVQIEELYQQLPAIHQTISQTNAQIESIVPLIPQVVSEVALVREQIPETLDRVEGIVADSKTISEEAGQGMFSGIVKGIVKMPLDILTAPIKLLGEDFSARHLFNDEDITLVNQTAEEVLGSEKLITKNWRNPRSGNQGSVKATEQYTYQGKQCRTLQFTMKAKKRSAESFSRDTCQTDDGKWEEAG